MTIWTDFKNIFMTIWMLIDWRRLGKDYGAPMRAKNCELLRVEMKDSKARWKIGKEKGFRRLHRHALFAKAHARQPLTMVKRLKPP
jgi:hypothetical protein